MAHTQANSQTTLLVRRRTLMRLYPGLTIQETPNGLHATLSSFPTADTLPFLDFLPVMLMDAYQGYSLTGVKLTVELSKK